MKLLSILLLLFSYSVVADVNERDHPEPGSQAKINRVIAQAWATQAPPVDNIAVYKNGIPKHSVDNGKGVNLGLSVGTVGPAKNGQMPRENNVVTRDNIVICLHCNGR
jgi:hypothetical protein